jgi:hypothetical protein
MNKVADGQLAFIEVEIEISTEENTGRKDDGDQGGNCSEHRASFRSSTSKRGG